jgi:HEAT repeat protein
MLRKLLSLALLFGLCTGALAAEAEDDPFQAAARYQFGQSRKPLNAVEDAVRKALGDAAKSKAAEAKLLALLKSGDATLHAKWFACRQLALVGSDGSVPALAAHLGEGDQTLGYMARFALEQIPAPEAAAALRQALGKTEGQARIGIINSLAARGDAEAVPALVMLLDADPETAAHAATALGKIGGTAARNALAKARSSAKPPVRHAAEDALLICANRLADAGKNEDAQPIFAQLHEKATAKHVRLGALAGLAKVGAKAALPLVMDALGSDDPELRGTALRIAEELPGAQATTAIAARISSASPEAAVALIQVLAARGDAAALDAVRQATESENEPVRAAAIAALGSLGGVKDVPHLLRIATEGPKSDRAAARQALARLSGNGVDQALTATLDGAEPPARAVIIGALADRASTQALPTILRLARDDRDRDVRVEALRALEDLAGAEHLDALVGLVVKPKTDAERPAAEKALAAAIRRLKDKSQAAPPVLAALEKEATEPAARCALLRIAGRIGGAEALTALRKAVKAEDPAVKNTAIRTLANWDTAEPLADLLAIARSAEKKTHKVLALRGALRMAALPHKRPAEESVTLYAEAMALATEPQEQKTILAALAKIKHPKALEMAASLLEEKAVANEAAATVVAIARRLLSTSNKQAVAALKQVAETFKGKEAGRMAEDALAMANLGANIAREGTATSPDGIEKDGAASGDAAAIDGNPDTYWDEADGKKLYRLVVTFPEPRRVAAIRILGYGHHNYAPRDFQVLADGKVVRTVKGAKYTDNALVVTFPVTEAKAIELKITGYYSQSPAIRELGIYEPPK